MTSIASHFIASRTRRVLLPLLSLLVATLAVTGATAAELDLSFGAGRGYVPVVAPNAISDTVAAIVRQPDDKFVVLGRRLVGGRGILLLQRFARDSTLDTTFGNQGTLSVDIAGESLAPRQLVVQP
ncbi:MAG: hypothetical protein ABI039_02995, partial [Vicinamibacterales bacterium]